MNEFDRVVLTGDLPEHELAAGDVGTVVDVYAQGEGYEVEFCTLSGETIAVATVTAEMVRSVGSMDMPHARQRAKPRGPKA